MRLRRAAAAFLADRPGAPTPHVPNPDRVMGLASARVDPTARIIVDAGRADAPGRIVLGGDVYLGRFAEIATTADGLLTIGEDTSIQDYAVMIGDIRIGAHCVFAPNVHVASHNHHFRDNPPWLIRDQDAAFAQTSTAPIIIEDDCWIGRNAVILPGVYIGRGAVIGANCVVSRDIPPYEVHAGAPNARIGERLRFFPPDKIEATDDRCLPYFYRGFRLGQRQLAGSRARGLIEARPAACLVMTTGERLQISGQRIGDSALELAFRVNGVDRGTRAIGERHFCVELAIPANVDNPAPAPLRFHTYIEIDASGPYGIETVLMVPGHWRP